MPVLDGPADIVSLLSDNWNSSNTNDITPYIDKITNVPFNQQFQDGKGYVLVYSVSEFEEQVGLGNPTRGRVRETITIDIRVHQDETLFNLYKCELRRILYSFLATGTDNYDCFEVADQNILNLSNRAKQYYRETRNVVLLKLNVEFGA